MWKIIKNELKYSQNMIFTIIVVIFVFMLCWLILGRENPDNSYPPLRMVYLNSVLILFITRVARQFKEKTLRIHALLPLSGWRIGLTRLLVFPLAGIAVLIGFDLFLILARPDFVRPAIVWDWFSLTGVLLLINVLPYLHRDLTRSFTSRLQKVTITLFYLLILLMLNLMYYFFIRVMESSGGASWLRPFKLNFHNHATAPPVILFLIFLSLGFMFITVITFQKRKTFFE